jgi:hypothetical protein
MPRATARQIKRARASVLTDKNKRQRIAMNALGGALSGLLSSTAKRNEKLLADETSKFTLRAKRRAIEFYPVSPLRVVTGFLRRNISRFTRRSGTTRVQMGLQNRMSYARYLEFGTKFITRRAFMSIPVKEQGEELFETLGKEIGFGE